MKVKYLVISLALVAAISLASCNGSSGDGGTSWPFPGVITASVGNYPASVSSGSITFAPGTPTWFSGTTASVSGSTLNTASTAWSYWSWTWSWVQGNAVLREASLSATTTGLSSDSAGDAVDSWGFLHILTETTLGDRFGQPYSFETTIGIEDTGLELTFPAQNLMGVDVSRKFLPNWNATVPNRDVWARWLNILTNNTLTPITVDVLIGGNLGSDSSSNMLASADGDLIPEAGIDNWLVTGDNSVLATTFGDPLIVNLMDGSIAYDKVDWLVTNFDSATTIKNLNYWTTGWSTTPYATSTMTQTASSDDVTWQWQNVTLQPGQTKVLMHVMLLGLEDMPNILGGIAGSVAQGNAYESAPAELIDGMDADEINQVINFPAARNNCNVSGGPESLTAYALITVTNATQATYAQSYALSDGSFGVCIDTVSGDTLWISDGANITSLVIP